MEGAPPAAVPPKERSVLLEYHPTHVTPEEMIRVYDELKQADARSALIDSVLANLEGDGAEGRGAPERPAPQPKSTEDLLAILEDGDDADDADDAPAPSPEDNPPCEKSVALKQLRDMKRKAPKSLNEVLDVKIPAAPKRPDRYVIVETQSDGVDGVDGIAFIEQDWPDEEAAHNGAAEADAPPPPPPSKRTPRLIKKKVIWDPDNPASFRPASELASPRPRPPRAPPAPDSAHKKRKMTEVDKLLMDEGAVNMIYQLERSNNSNVPNLVLKPNSKSMISLSKERQILIDKTKIIKDAVFSVAKTDADDSESKAVRTRRECVRKTFKKPGSKGSLQSPSPSEASAADAPADESRIIRRHSSSSFSSGCLSPRPQSPSELSAGKAPEDDSPFEKLTDSDRSAKNDSGIQASTPFARNSAQMAKSKGPKRKYFSDTMKKSKILNNHFSPDRNSTAKPTMNYVYSQVSLELKNGVANVVIKADDSRGLFDTKVFHELNLAFAMILKFNTNIVSITTQNETLCSGLDLYGLLEENEESRRKNVNNLLQKFRDFIINILKFKGIVVVGIDGECCGVGIIFLALADFVLASKRSTFSYSADFRRALPTEGLSLFDEMCHMVSKVKQEFILFGRKLNALDALNFGLISRTCENEIFSSVLNDFITEVSATHMQVFKMNKHTMWENKFVLLMELLDDEFFQLTKYWNSATGQEVIKNIFVTTQ